MSDKGCAASLVRSDAWLEDLFSEPIYIGIHKNSAGRITFVVNDGTDKVDETGRHYSSIRTSCSIKGMSFADKIITCANRLREPSNSAICLKTEASHRGCAGVDTAEGLR